MLYVESLDLTSAQLRRLAGAEPARYPVLFDSASSGPLAGWTVLAIASGAALWRDNALGLQQLEVPVALRDGFLATLDAWWASERIADSEPHPPGPWRPGWAVWLGYELAAEIEPSLRLPPSPGRCGAFALRTPAALVHEHRSGRTWGVAERDYQHLLSGCRRDAAALPPVAGAVDGALLAPGSLREEPPEVFLAAVRRAQDAIAAGDVYQANLSRLWTATLACGVDGGQVYERLRRANPAPFASRAQFAGMDILSSSPERLLQIDAGAISTRPIAGTRPRSGTADNDIVEAAALLEHFKERAEHVMLIDLERNDLGRVCVAGSVQVSEFMVVESYAHVHHIVSNVRGLLRADVSPVDALRAVFPGGTITGCPKIRCMALIAELEACGRGVYTGSLGWLGREGNADFNILIRTLALQERQLSFRAGAGIVADSVPELELDETRAKARGLLRALGETR